MTREEIKNTPEIVDFMLDKSVIADSRMKLHKRLKEICELAIKALEQDELLDYVTESIEAEKKMISSCHDLASEDYHKGIIYAFECMKMKLI